LLVFLGNGDGTLQPALHIPLGASPQGLQVGDIDRDGRSDVIVRLRDGDYQVFPGKNLQAGVRYRGGGPSSGPGFKLPEFDGDGIPDLVAVSSDTARVSILSGAIDGTFGMPRVFAAGAAPGNGWASQDLDGNGSLDLAIPNPDAGTITLLFRVSAPPAVGEVTRVLQHDSRSLLHHGGPGRGRGHRSRRRRARLAAHGNDIQCRRQSRCLPLLRQRQPRPQFALLYRRRR
jgi:hypothetical protein